MTENEAFIYESIFNQIRMGFLSLDEIQENILEEIEDNEFDDEISEEWAFDKIREEYQKLLSESKQWKSPTDTERLIKAFDELCGENIIALHNAGYTTSDGEYEVVEVERELQENEVESDGYCFYHEQDLVRAVAVENPSLYIAFQKVDNSDDAVTIEVGKKVAEVLRNNGFEVNWNETSRSKIEIPGFRWQKIFDEDARDLQDYSEVVDRMIQ
ncbi:DUF6891 domain-containing protein [Flavobacterium reichenbachii]|uniref:DUF6891 domain-containing protein n=1 Tax=Flavobacterium reichenbachii TaxID=362418 RepID=A0A085ZMG2_9FLAO|nr:hypothetical protein [Flavobacterium reichenbachii]KFF05626.1 hypothetical protein IW19_08895 [Flavobacterium reichenbachii]OXB17958.1 hypothetical protein B0A68_03205 [Flavobacterium reichenbachii]